MFTYTAPIDQSLEDKLLGQFEENESEGGGFPYIQALTYPNEDTIDTKDSRPWGYFLNEEVATSIGFRASSDWLPTTFYTVEGQGFNQAVLEIPAKKRSAYEKENREIFEHRGFVCTRMSFHVLHASKAEVEEKIKTKDGGYWRFAGLQYRDQPTADGERRTEVAMRIGEKDEDNRPTHRWVRRYLIMLVDDAGQILHDAPIQYKAKGAAGATFSIELNEFYKDLNAAYGKLRGSARKRMFDPRNQIMGDSRAFVRVGFGFDLYKPGVDSGSYLVPSARVAPVAPADASSSQPKSVSRGKDKERECMLFPVDLKALMVDRSQGVGLQIQEALQENLEFSKPNQGNDTTEDKVNSSASLLEEGEFDPSTINYEKDGTVGCVFDTGSQRIPVIIPGDLVNAVDAGQVSIEAVIPSDGGPANLKSYMQSGSETTEISEEGQQVLIGQDF